MDDRGEVERYLADQDPDDRIALARVYEVARRIVPDAIEGRSYNMPALLYRGKGLVSSLRTKRFLSLYPFSGHVVAAVADDLEGFERTTGSIHFAVDHELPASTLERLVTLRRDEIDRSAH